jgi:hypothetical protein
VYAARSRSYDPVLSPASSAPDGVARNCSVLAAGTSATSVVQARPCTSGMSTPTLDGSTPSTIIENYGTRTRYTMTRTRYVKRDFVFKRDRKWINEYKLDATDCECQSCADGVIYESRTALIGHIRDMHQVQLLTCKHCGQVHLSLLALFIHQDKCTSLDFGWLESSTIIENDWLKNWKRKLKNVYKLDSTHCKCLCCYDGVIYESKTALIGHIRDTHQVQLITCKHCGDVHLTLLALSIHQDKCLGWLEAYEAGVTDCLCQLCNDDVKYPTKSALVRHVESNHGNKCKYCGYVIKLQDLDTHMIDCKKEQYQVVARQRETTYPCETCGWEFDKQRSLEYHIGIHVEYDQLDYPFKCPRCSETYCLQASFNDHVNRCHFSEPMTPPYRCHVTQCDVVLESCQDFERHIRTHDVTPTCLYKCLSCNEQFVLMDSFNEHRHAHKGFYTCYICGKKMAPGGLNHLDSHIRGMF